MVQSTWLEHLFFRFVYFAAISAERERGHGFSGVIRNICKRSYCSENGVQIDKLESETAVIHDFHVE